MINEENIKQSFRKVKEDISDLKAEISRLNTILEEIRNLNKVPLREDPIPSQEDSEPISIGNKGVANSQRQPTTANRRQPVDNDSQRQPTTAAISELKENLDSSFKVLTDREFSVFMALYDLDKEKGGEISYFELSQQLNISESTVRDYINLLIRKNIPIQKDRFFNGKVSLSIKEAFKQLDLYQKLLSLKASRKGQKTLFDI